MKNFVLKEINLLSIPEKSARSVKFDPSSTIILGANDTGKSSLLKSVYRTFGAEPAKLHPTWIAADVISAVRFSIGDHELIMLRVKQGLFAIFDEAGHLIQSFRSVTNELGPFLATLFDFGITLLDKSEKLITPPPAYFFLPYYVDQDKGWLDSWSSFANLGQLSSWRQDLAEYHTGIKPNSYYKTSADVERLKKQADELSTQLKVLEGARDRISKELTTDTFSIDLDSFKAEIAQLLVECEKLNKIEEEYKSKLIDLRNQRTTIIYQMKVAEGAVRESRSDYKFAVEDLNQEDVHCPMCDAVYHNSFAERFAIAEDEGRARELLTQLRGDDIEIMEKLESLQKKYETTHLELSRLNEVLASKKQNIQLRDVIQSEGKREVQKAFVSHLAHFQESLNTVLGQLQRSELELKNLKKELKELKVKIVNFYLRKMDQYLYKLDVKTLKQSSYKNVHSRISETGSDQPRALLAYYFSILETIKEFSPTTFCPIVIDSPNQQAQDRDSLKKMISFIFEQMPKDTQLVLGVEDLAGIEPVGTVIELETKYRLLQKEHFAEAKELFQPLLDSIFQAADLTA